MVRLLLSIFRDFLMHNLLKNKNLGFPTLLDGCLMTVREGAAWRRSR